jgi:hypothetical protein
MYSKLALVVIAAVGSAALVASAQTPNPSDDGVRSRSYRTATIATTAPASSTPDQVEPSSVTVTSNRQNSSSSGAAGGSGVSSRGGGSGWTPNYVVGGPLNRMFVTDDAGHETDQLIRQLGEAKSDSDRDKLKAKLGEVLEKQFEHRQKRHEGEIAELEAQIKKLKELVGRRLENRREIIARRLEQVLRESQGLGW